MNPELQKKSLTDLRTIAQAYGVTDIFEKDAAHLTQEIELKQVAMVPPPPPPPPRPNDVRIMTARPASIVSPMSITESLEPHISLGLKLSFEGDHWSMTCGKKSDTGTLRMPLRDIIGCAERVLR